MSASIEKRLTALEQKAAYAKFITADKVIRRIEVVCPMTESKVVLNKLFDAGYRVIRSGPYTDAKMFPECDDKRCQFIAEKEICT